MPATALTAETVAPYDFLDLGCSRGRSLEYGRQRFGGTRGLGVDLNAAKVQEARDSGFEAIVADARELTVSNQVRWVQMMDFLEHLPDVDAAERVVASSAKAATDFLFIFHPSFEREDYLHSLGLRLYWWEWRTHTNHLTIGDYCEMFHRPGSTSTESGTRPRFLARRIRTYSARTRRRISTSGTRRCTGPSLT